MFRISNYFICLILAISLGFTGVTVAGVMAEQQHAAMMNQTSTNCLTYCAYTPHLVTSLPTTLPLVFLVISFLGLLAAFFIPRPQGTENNYAAHPRPSPNLIKLYAHFLH